MANIRYDVPCPSCEANVTIRSSASIGKKVECPKCKYRFVVPDPDDEGGDEDKKKSKGAKKGKKAAKSEGNSKVLIGVIVGVLALAVLTVGGYFMFFDGDGQSQAKGTTNSGGGSGTAPPPPSLPNPPGQGGGEPGGADGAGGGGEQPATAAAQPLATISDKDVSNLLPNDARAVYRVNVDKFASTATPIYTAFFDTYVRDLFRNSMAFKIDDVQTYVHCVVDPDREPFAVIRTKTEIDAKILYERLKLEKPKNPVIKNRNFWLIKSNAFIDAASRAFSTQSLMALAGLPPLPEQPRPGGQAAKQPQYTLCIYDATTLFISTELVMERYLSDLGENGLPPFKSDLTPPEFVIPEPTTPGGAPGEPGGAAPGGAAVPGGKAEMSAPSSSTVTRQPSRNNWQAASPPGLPPPPGQPPGGGAAAAPSLPPPPGGGGPGGPGGPAGPGGGAQRGTPRRVFTSIPTYRTIDPQLKKMLNVLEEDERNIPAVVYAEVLDQRILNGRALGQAYRETGNVLLGLLSQIKVVGVAFFEFNRDKTHALLSLEYVSDDDAKRSVSEQIAPMLGAGQLILDLALGTRTTIRNNVTGQTSGGGPGSQGGFAPPGGFGRGGGVQGPPGGAGDDPPTPGGRGGRQPGQGVPTGPTGPPGGGGGRFPGQGVPGGPGGADPDAGAGGPGFGGGQGPQSQAPAEGQGEITLDLADRVVTINAWLNWPEDKYMQLVQTGLTRVASQVKGRMAVLTGEIDQFNLASVASKLQRAGKPFPRGTAEREVRDDRYRLPPPPEQRVSFFAELLPYIGKAGLKTQIQDRKHPWFAKENLNAAEAWVPELLVPYYPQESWRASHPLADGRSLGATNYVALSGLGFDSARFDPNDPQLAKRVGMVGYDWGSRPDEVKDGLANTIYLIQSPPGMGRPWIAGGGATVIGVDDQTDDPMRDFVHRAPDGRRGTYVLMADGSVRWVKEGTDPKIFRGMVTRAGGETFNLDEAAPKIQPTRAPQETELKQGNATGTGPAPSATKDLVDEEELKKFQGKWKIKYAKMKFMGQTITSEQLAQVKPEINFVDRRVLQSMTLPTGLVEVPPSEIFKLDPKTKTIDVRDPSKKDDKPSLGVYEFSGGVLKIRSSKDGKPRPAKVAVPEENSEDVYVELEKVQ